MADSVIEDCVLHPVADRWRARWLAALDSGVTPESSRRESPRLLIIGLGNPLVSDDSVGLRIAEELVSRFAGVDAVDVQLDYWGGLRLMERMMGYDFAVVIDAICTGAAPGARHYLRTDSIATQKSASAHDVSLPTALALGRHAGAHLPEDDHILLIAVEAADVLTFQERCTSSVAAAIPAVVDDVVVLLQPLAGGHRHDLS